jgi:tight adherence protein B
LRVLVAAPVAGRSVSFGVAERHPGLAIAGVAACGGAAAFAVGGPVAAVAGALYPGLVVRAVLRRRAARRAGEATARALDAVAMLAADLRAGAVPDDALAAVAPVLSAAGPEPVRRLAERVAGAWLVAESSGAPLAGLLDRLEADARGLDRIRREGTAQAAGATATAWLLAGLPLAGIALGYGIGADPVRILLHTPIGMASAAVALLFQLAGLAWSSRLARAIGDAA